MYTMTDRGKQQNVDIETLRTHIAEHRNTIEQYKTDKQTLYQG